MKRRKKKRIKTIRPRKTKKKKFNIFKTLSLLLILGLIASTPLFIQRLIKIKKTTCSSQYGECPEVLQNQLDVLPKTSLDISKEKLSKTLTDNLLVESYILQYQVPNTLEARIIVKKPRYAIYDKSSGAYLLTDESGVVLEKSNNTNLGYVVAESVKTSLGEKIDEKYLFAAKLIHSLNWLYPITYGELSEQSFFVKLEEGSLIIFPLEGSVDVLIGSFRLIYSRLNQSEVGIKLNDIRQVDLRFKNPVLR